MCHLSHACPDLLCSGRYYLRYLQPWNRNALVDAEHEKYWMPVDLYVGALSLLGTTVLQLADGPHQLAAGSFLMAAVWQVGLSMRCCTCYTPGQVRLSRPAAQTVSLHPAGLLLS